MPIRRPKLRRIRKRWHDGLASLTYLDGKRRRKQDEIDFIPAGENVTFDLNDNEITQLARVLGSDSLARRVRTIQRERYPYGTVPEIIFLEFLERKGEDFVYQASVLGGYRSGGLVPDFLIMRGGETIAVLIQGIYWHNIPGKREKDISDKLRLLGAYYEGRVISTVVFLWESAMMTTNPTRDRVLEEAAVGIENGP